MTQGNLNGALGGLSGARAKGLQTPLFPRYVLRLAYGTRVRGFVGNKTLGGPYFREGGILGPQVTQIGQRCGSNFTVCSRNSGEQALRGIRSVFSVYPMSGKSFQHVDHRRGDLLEQFA